MSDLETMLDSYIATALWSTNDESDESGGEPLDKNYNDSDVSEALRQTMNDECLAFMTANVGAIESAFAKKPNLDWSQVGHDFWLTRNGHGCGFWDGDWPEPEAAQLTEAAHACGEVNLYVSDDGEICS